MHYNCRGATTGEGVVTGIHLMAARRCMLRSSLLLHGCIIGANKSAGTATWLWPLLRLS